MSAGQTTLATLVRLGLGEETGRDRMMINIQVAWVAFVMGCVSGAVPGLFFYDREWLGGYSSWRRRMIRLGHISFFGIGLLNLSLALTAIALGVESGLRIPSGLLVVGAVAMPMVCYLSAWRPVFRNFFFVPAMSVTTALAMVAWRIII